MNEIGRYLNSETRNVQNPALGGMLIWRFIAGYERGSGFMKSTPMPLLFLINPMLLNREIADFIRSTQEASGLRAFAGKFSKSGISKTDLLYTLPKSSLNMRKFTLESLALAISSNLITINVKNGMAISLSSSNLRTGIPTTVRHLLKAAEKLGVWCSNLTLHEISVILKVGF